MGSSVRTGKVAVGHPVDVATGTLFHEFEDFIQPGRFPLAFGRRYSTGLIGNSGGMFGQGWSSPLEMSLRRDLDGWTLTTEDGETEIAFQGFLDGPDASEAVVSLGDFCELRRDGDTMMVVRWDPESDKVKHYRFAPVNGRDWRLLSVDGADGHGFDITYNNDGRIHLLRQRREGRGLLLRYDLAGRVVEVFLSTGSVQRSILRYGYDRQGRLSEFADPAGFQCSYTYDTAGRKTREKLRNGAVWFFEFDQAGRCIQAKGQGSFDEKVIRYANTERVTEVTDSRGGLWRYQWNQYGQVESLTTPLGHTTANTFDDHGRLSKVTNPNGESHKFVYDDRGDRTAVIDPAGATTRFEYNHRHQRLFVVDKSGHTWGRTYDNAGRLLTLSDPLGHLWQLDWNALGDINAIHQPNGGVRKFSYTPAGDVRTQTDALGHTFTYEFNESGQWIATVDPLGQATRCEFDDRGLLVSIQWPDGSTCRNEYGPTGDLFRSITPDGSVKTYRTSGCSSQWASVEGPDGEWRWLWDSEPGLLLEVRNPKGEAYRFDYDLDGRMVHETAFDGIEFWHDYDPAGNRLATRTANGRTTRYEWNSLGLPISATYPDGSTKEFKYDPMGRMLKVVDNSGEVIFARDPLGRATIERRDDFEVLRGFDEMGNIAERSTSLGHKTRWVYDLNGRLQGVYFDGDFCRLDRDLLGREVRRTFPGGAELRQQYDPVGRLEKQWVESNKSASSAYNPQSGEVVYRTFEYDRGGRLRVIRDLRWGDTNYNYDTAGRIVSAARADGVDERFSYDAAGNIVGIHRSMSGGEEVNETRDLALGGRVIRQGTTTYEYDAQGSTIGAVENPSRGDRKRWTYDWDSRGRLVALVTPGGERWTYAYDAFDRRISKTGPGSSIRYEWDGDMLVHEVDAASSLTTWVFAPRRPIPFAKRDSAGSFYLIPDHMSTPRELVTGEGKLAWAGELSVWGDLTRCESSLTTCPFRFSGQYADPESGLSYNRFRYFVPAQMQYLSRDPTRPFTRAGSYSYVANPLLWVDVYGLLAEVIYGDPDALNRPTGATAMITPHDIGTGTEANSAIRPPGFESGNHPHHHERGHLIGNQLGGDGNDPRNLVTLTGGTNHPHMEALEARVRAHVEAGNFVEVRITPIYDGNHPVPTAVHYEATDLRTGNRIVDERVENGRHKNYKNCSH